MFLWLFFVNLDVLVGLLPFTTHQNILWLVWAKLWHTRKSISGDDPHPYKGAVGRQDHSLMVFWLIGMSSYLVNCLSIWFKGSWIYFFLLKMIVFISAWEIIVPNIWDTLGFLYQETSQISSVNGSPVTVLKCLTIGG